MKKKNSLICVVILFSFFSIFFMSCAIHTHYVQTGSRTYEETNPDNIKIYSGEPPVEYVVIGSIAVDSPGDSDKAIEYLKEKAALTGADAVIQVKMTTMSTHSSRLGISGVTVKYKK